MITKVLIYKNGHFYDGQTKTRLEIKDGVEFSISCAGNDDFFEASPAGSYPLTVLSSGDLLKKLLSDGEVTDYNKLLDGGNTIYFTINRPIGRISSHEFEVQLLEDLYMYSKKTWKQGNYRLYDCACKLTSNSGNTIDFFEPIYGKSLNELYKNTYVHYFGNEGSPTINSMERFYKKGEKGNKPIGLLRQTIYKARELKEKFDTLS